MNSLQACTVILKKPTLQRQFLRYLVDAGMGGIAIDDCSTQCLMRGMDVHEFLRFLHQAPFHVEYVSWGGDVEITQTADAD